MKAMLAWSCAVTAIVSAVFTFLTLAEKDSARKEADVQMVREKHGCTPTNEFVGKNADRLWTCRDGLKYKEGDFWYWARDERRK